MARIALFHWRLRLHQSTAPQGQPAFQGALFHLEIMFLTENRSFQSPHGSIPGSNGSPAGSRLYIAPRVAKPHSKLAFGDIYRPPLGLYTTGNLHWLTQSSGRIQMSIQICSMHIHPPLAELTVSSPQSPPVRRTCQ